MNLNIQTFRPKQRPLFIISQVRGVLCDSMTPSVALETYNKWSLYARHAHHSQRQHILGDGDDIQVTERV